MTQKQTEPPRADTERRPWGRWQEDWFATPGDVDDFTFYDAPEEDHSRCTKKTG